jgi:hypothetical protein
MALAPAKVSPSEESLLKAVIAPAARKFWRERRRDRDCVSGPDIRAIDVAPGAFTRPKAEQKAILYSFCEVGHNQNLDGIAIVENGAVVSHIVFEGASNTAIGALPDINGNGLAEIVVAAGGTNQGTTWSGISIVEISGPAITRFGQTVTSSDNCGANEDDCTVEANRISVKRGASPAFYSETFVRKGDTGPWRKSAALSALTLHQDETRYELLK